MESQVSICIQSKPQVRENHQSVVTVKELTATYPGQDECLPTQESTASLAGILSLINNSSGQLSNRICCYALAKVKGRQFINTILLSRGNDPKKEYYHAFQRGHRWNAIIAWISPNQKSELTGIIAVLTKRRL